MTITFADIEAARRRIGDAIFVSPCAYTHTLSEMVGCKLYLKLENLQMTGSFKERGAANKLLQLDANEKKNGVIAASAGNHAQGVAYHAKRLGIESTIVMPVLTPLVKVTATRGYGAKVILHGANFDEAYEEARRIEKEQNLTFIHPFDDLQVIAGQGTIGLELLEQNPYLDAIIVTVGGGGLAAGVACAVKETNPRIKVYGVEPKAVASMRAALDAGRPVRVEGARTIAEGAAVRQVGKETFEACKKYLDDVVSVDEEEIAEAILLLLEREKTVAEGAGAAPLAALVHKRLPVDGKRVAAILCGGNIDVNLVSRIIERGLVKSGRMIRIRACISDVPGSLAALLTRVGSVHANVLHVQHDRMGSELSLGQTLVELVLETRGFEHIESVIAAIREVADIR